MDERRAARVRTHIGSRGTPPGPALFSFPLLDVDYLTYLFNSGVSLEKKTRFRSQQDA
jgi:hypothetical protein